MHFSLLGFLILLLVAAVCGAIGRAIAGGSTGGCLVSIVVGFVGALLGSWIAHKMHLPELFVVSIDRHPFPILWSIIGAALFVAVVHLISGRR
ncbi:MAG TPA: GlsB/YeaQ/YmgE family stress response membrane protein [Thermoanaerobaculia bacterium]|nr:GlsB/YeaQ/YmgE family stress response membrane protein [Thermoanaerobaculia bacterium]